MFGWIKRIDWFNRRAARELAKAQSRARLHAEDAEVWKRLALDGGTQLGLYRRALDTIISQETPGANATVKRMVRIAREARGRV